MLKRSDSPVESAIADFAEFGVEAAYFVPTPTGLGKSIVDAHAGIRSFLANRGIHSFATQEQGRESLVRLGIRFVGVEKFIDLEISLYRPSTKNGDPRLWISTLSKFVSPWNLLALIADVDGQLYLVNCSDSNVIASRFLEGSPLFQILHDRRGSAIATELLQLLHRISSLGYVESLRAGDTGIGFTLETLLGISANSSKKPDYKGIELKSGRRGHLGVQRTRSNLFSQVPDWKTSRLKSGLEIVNTYGYREENQGRQQLYCTVSNVANPQGLYFDVDENQDSLENLVKNPDAASSEKVVRWQLQVLRDRLLEKHRETFWVRADSRINESGREEFRFEAVTHTRSPLTANLVPLFQVGKITMDYTLSLVGPAKTRDHGYLFKIWPKDLALLFPSPVEYELITAS